MTDRTPSQNSPTEPGSQPDDGTAHPRFVEEGAFPRLQERTQTQLGLINSLLITSAVGLLAFAANASSDSAELKRLGWREWLLLSGAAALLAAQLPKQATVHRRLAFAAVGASTSGRGAAEADEMLTEGFGRDYNAD